MRTRTSDRWKCKPGYFDVHHVENIYESSNDFGIPDLLPADNYLPEGFVPYNIRVRSEIGYTGLGIHFFIDDYRFENVWIRPTAGLERVMAAEVVLTPDFSVYTDFPRAVQIYNIYRSRWIGRFWQDNDIKVIPTVSWADKESFDYCFLGIPKNSLVAVSTVGVDKESTHLFEAGFDAMVQKLEPSRIVCYGKPAQFMSKYGIDIRGYKSGFRGIKHLRAGGKEEIPASNNNINLLAELEKARETTVA